jgi:hypothetical protein
MADKMECPACNSWSSSIAMAVVNGRPCPVCGVSAEAIIEIYAVRETRATEALKGRVEFLVIENDRLVRESEDLRDIVDSVKELINRKLNA